MKAQKIFISIVIMIVFIILVISNIDNHNRICVLENKSYACDSIRVQEEQKLYEFYVLIRYSKIWKLPNKQIRYYVVAKDLQTATKILNEKTKYIQIERVYVNELVNTTKVNHDKE